MEAKVGRVLGDTVYTFVYSWWTACQVAVSDTGLCIAAAHRGS